MTVRERTRFSAEYKDEAVRLVIESGRPIAEVAREFVLAAQGLAHATAPMRHPTRAPVFGDVR